jgi:alkane 1-monooxygenase
MHTLSSLPYYTVFCFHVIIVAGVMLGGAWTFSAAILGFIIVPLIDLTGWRDHRNHTPEEYEQLEERWSFRVVTMVYAVAQVGITIFGAWAAGTQHLSVMEFIGLGISIITVNGNGINFSHELMHKNTRLERFLGKIMLLPVSYMHFTIEHTSGHHVRVATPADPATARKNESFYQFFPRTVIGSFKSAWDLELKRLAKRGLPMLHWRNQMLWFVALPIAFAAALTLAFGPLALVFFVWQSLGAIQLLEMVNYIEHYGLMRREIKPGRYESVKAIHSWEAREVLSNLWLIKLERHADHHVNPLRRYQSLRVFDESPQLPTGYMGMMWLSAVPPLFFKVMNPRVEAHERRVREMQTGFQDAQELTEAA